MNDKVIKINNLSKSYRIGHQSQRRHNTLRDLLAEQAALLGRKLRHPFESSLFGSSDYIEDFWALDNVTFEVQRGDRVAIIGRNGAGKSTLLKILSRITEPTRGRVEIEGRVASLLEVGTGFHSELTGRENIFLNGAILGMTRHEIRRKFDEIVAFSEIDRFLDTPVKRYSSGMYVRLAFAVAAHLEPEILIVDEVLAVGDAEFQKKCLGKMEEVGREGRTVLFVSHNMAAVQSLCNRGILLGKGAVSSVGPVEEVIRSYFDTMTVDIEAGEDLSDIPRPAYATREVEFTQCRVLNAEKKKTVHLKYGEPFSLSLKALSKIKHQALSVFAGIQTQTGTRVFTASSADAGVLFDVEKGGSLVVEVSFPSLRLVPGHYRVFLAIRRGEITHDILAVMDFEIKDQPFEGLSFHTGTDGLVSIEASWL